jgi:hypothetical protein
MREVKGALTIGATTAAAMAIVASDFNRDHPNYVIHSEAMMVPSI